ncbi:MAG: lipocalin-like domain-containing protein [Sphingomonadaceae bacterium]|nr:lipocalin-like domain-containing protein [Sphingomonadaceae bacterium]MBV9185971.1 lipocalin-like domain-containing protein [Acidobacteriota bacterium]
MDELTGSWRLLSHVAVNQATGERTNPFGASPSGSLMVHDGRMIVVITPEDRGGGAPVIAYAGRISVRGDGRLATAVEVASVPQWVGGEQVRGWRRDGDRLELTTPPGVPPGGEHPVIAVLTWLRADAVAGGGASD